MCIYIYLIGSMQRYLDIHATSRYPEVFSRYSSTSRCYSPVQQGTQYKGGSGWGVSVSIYMQLAGLTRPIWRRPCPLPHHHLLLPGGGGGGEGGGQGQQGQHGQGGGSAAQYGVAPVHSHHIIISSCVDGRPTFF